MTREETITRLLDDVVNQKKVETALLEAYDAGWQACMSAYPAELKEEEPHVD